MSLTNTVKATLVPFTASTTKDVGVLLTITGTLLKSVLKVKLPEEEILTEPSFALTAQKYVVLSFSELTTLEVSDLSIEEPYFWILDELKQNFQIIEKLEDSFAAAENSAFFGVTQQRLGAQQDKVSQFLATTGKMIKELFQMVRELRIIDERLQYYDEASKQLEKDIGSG